MEQRMRKSPTRKQLNKTMSTLSLAGKQHKSKEKPSKKQKEANTQQKKREETTDHIKLKKRIEMMQPPDLLLKIHYKGKKLSVPIPTLDHRSLNALIGSYITRFEHEILKNPHFSMSQIEAWKTSSYKPDPLKDYYFQLDKPMLPFKGEILELEPIWKACPEKRQVMLSDFEIIKCVGTGGFSKVFMVRKKSNGKFYALKLMEKEGLLDNGRETVVINQRDINVELDNPHILRMDYAFETRNFVAFALQYCPGGELFHYLRKVKRMNQEDARYCFVEILIGFQYLHNKKIIYRDIKPENIIIDGEGNLKIADFGLSKQVTSRDQMAYTYCGSPEYMAPEMLNRSGHSFTMDYYCLGALLYQLVTGNPPFYSRDVEKIYESIQNDEIDFPSYVNLSQELQGLLTSLLMKDPRRRLGSLDGIRQILSHPWVRKLKVADILEKRVQTPIQIDLLTFNINEEEIGASQDQLEQKLREQEAQHLPFQPMFEDFYFARDQLSGPVLQDIRINLRKDDDIVQQRKAEKQNRSKTKSNDTKEDNRLNLTVEKSNKISTVATNNNKKLKKVKSKKKVLGVDNVFVQRARKRPEKSLKRDESTTKLKKNIIQRVMSPVERGQRKSGLKRIKSSGALNKDMFKRDLN